VIETPNLVDMLWSTLKQLERSLELSPDDPALLELQHHLVRLLAELERRKAA
jgi:hypothetical protein